MVNAAPVNFLPDFPINSPALFTVKFLVGADAACCAVLPPWLCVRFACAVFIPIFSSSLDAPAPRPTNAALTANQVPPSATKKDVIGLSFIIAKIPLASSASSSIPLLIIPSSIAICFNPFKKLPSSPKNAPNMFFIDFIFLYA